MKENRLFILLSVFTGVSILFLSIGYSALNTELSISGEAYVRVEENIRVTDIKLIEATNDAYETYNTQYSKDTTSMFVTLPNNKSTITYEVTIENKSSDSYYVEDIVELHKTNSNFDYEFSDKFVGEVIQPNNIEKLTMKFTAREVVQEIVLKLQYNFKKVEQVTFAFNYTGSVQEFVVPYNGTYKMEAWGASGGTSASRVDSGFGGYTSGEIKLDKGTKLYVYVGEEGQNGAFGENDNYGIGAPVTFNGGGSGGTGGGTGEYPPSSYQGGPSGGGATDIRLVSSSWNDFNSLKSRIMVAGGGGGTGYDTEGAFYTAIPGGNNWGLTGGAGSTVKDYLNIDYTDRRGIGGTQNSGYAFGYGGGGDNTGYIYCHGHAGGGGGYYGGTGGLNTGGSCFIIGGGAGSSFISGYQGCNAVSESSTVNNIIHTGHSNHYSGYIFNNSKMIAGTLSMPTHDGTSSMIGNVGHGYAKITFISV